MPKLTGGETSILAYLADYPDAPDAEQVISRLGPAAREVALVLIGKHHNPSHSVQTCAQALKNWAKNKEKLRGLFEVRSCPDCNHPHMCKKNA